MQATLQRAQIELLIFYVPQLIQGCVYSPRCHYFNDLICMICAHNLMKKGLETEKTASAFTQRVDDEGTDEEAYSDAGSNLDHGCGNIEHNIVQAIPRIIGKGAVDLMVRVGDCIRSPQPAEQAACGSKASRHLSKYSREKRRSGNTVS
jgi:hypothetical protein